MKKVNAVVVTYNRKELLMECLDSILNQTYEVERIVVIDNNSNDDTKATLIEKGYIGNPRIEYHYLSKNIGGAGGFNVGMKHANAHRPDWVWIMDDDTIPTETCLEELLKAEEKIDDEVSFLASSVRGMNGEAMNVPKINKKQFTSYTDWYKHLDKGLVQIVKATFVSLLINNKAIDKCGLPWAPFFIWGDDSEYTQRIIRDYGPLHLWLERVWLSIRESDQMRFLSLRRLTRTEFRFISIITEIILSVSGSMKDSYTDSL